MSEEKDPWADLVKYPKFFQPPTCVYPERDNCNYDKTTLRCEHMKCENILETGYQPHWYCDLRKKKI